VSGPLAGLRVVEFAGLAPAPFGCMVLADLGAEVIRIDRPGAPPAVRNDPLTRGRRSVSLDLKKPAAVEVLLRLVERSDVLVEGFRPGVMERLGLGPARCHERNPGLIYARMTGWGQHGPLADAAGHDIDYIAVAGSLEPIGQRGGRPIPPINLIGDFAGGGLLMATGILAALHERERSGRGQVIDAAMVDGAALIATFVHGVKAAGGFPAPRGENLLDGGAPYYDTYLTADDRYVAIGALEEKFYAELVTLLELDRAALPANRHDPANWPALRELIAAAVRRRTPDEWAALAIGSDACLAPVLAPEEAAEHPHNKARENFVELAGVVQPAPAPRFDRTPAGVPGPPAYSGEHTAEVLGELGLTPEQIAQLS
jgi:alpha-methylacyl-CoA racemase